MCRSTLTMSHMQLYVKYICMSASTTSHFYAYLFASARSSPKRTNWPLITHDWKELEAWEWSHCVCLVTMDRLKCHTTYLGHHVTFTSNQMLTWHFKVIMHFSMRLTRGTRWRANCVISFLSSEVICEEPFSARNRYFDLFRPSDPCLSKLGQYLTTP